MHTYICFTGVKLVGGAWPWEGRVELFVNGEWGTICNDDFDVNDARVICKMAGYSPSGYLPFLTYKTNDLQLK